MTFGLQSRPESVVYECTALVGVNKAGTLRADASGYYPVILGAYEYPNSAGAIYSFEDAKGLFENSGSLMRRIASGNCRGEYGHPRKQVGWSNRDFINRVCDIYEPNISHHIRKVWIERNVTLGNKRVPIVIMGEVKPAGPMGHALRESFENSSEDVCFSVRSLTKDRMMGSQVIKGMLALITWDFVNEPGIDIARKYVNPALESRSESHTFTRTQFDLARKDAVKASNGMESSGVKMIDELSNRLGWGSDTILPPSARW